MSVCAQVTRIDGVHFEAMAGPNHTVAIEGPPEVGGRDVGFRPMDLMLLGMAGCVALDVLLILRRMRREVAGYRVNVLAERADDPPRVFTLVRLEHIIQGEGLTEAGVRRAIELADRTYCSGSAMFAKTAKIEHSIVIPQQGRS